MISILADATAPWWYDVLAFLALLGYLSLALRFIRRIIAGIGRAISRPITYIMPTQYNVNLDVYSRDPTRPNFTDDESAAWVNVTHKMEQFERRAIEGKPK